MRTIHTSALPLLPFVVVGLLGLSAAVGGTGNTTAQRPCCSEPALTSGQQAGQVAAATYPGVHDPVMTKEGDTYYLFYTGRGIAARTSKDMAAWSEPGRVFEQPAAWTSERVPGFRDHFWAPDIVFFNAKWHLYYSVSTFGRNRSAIGLATSVTLDPKRPDYRWVDEGPVVESKPGDDYNAIDPNVVLDEKGEPWLSFGSFWSGIKLVRLDKSTGKPAEATPKLTTLASRPNTPEIKRAVEAPFIVSRNGFYYLFVSFDFCCRGVASTYNIRVGRATKVTGPYTDRDGKPMVEGGGTLVLAGSGRWKGPGHNAVYREKETDRLVYHAYDAEDNGRSKLHVDRMEWDGAGWPVVKR
jgi:arabinan endo-1,5-alpha-L-arabinosidase